jgi:hypothetical protein
MSHTLAPKTQNQEHRSDDNSQATQLRGEVDTSKHDFHAPLSLFYIAYKFIGRTLNCVFPCTKRCTGIDYLVLRENNRIGLKK